MWKQAHTSDLDRKGEEEGRSWRMACGFYGRGQGLKRHGQSRRKAKRPRSDAKRTGRHVREKAARGSVRGERARGAFEGIGCVGVGMSCISVGVADAIVMPPNPNA